MGKLQGKTAIITGGGTGIGKGIAECFYEEGASLLLAQRRLELARRVAQGLDPEGRRIHCYQADISDFEQVQELVNNAVAKLGKIDVLVNNASLTGMPAISPVLEMSREFIDRVVDVNLKGTVYCSQLVGRVMRSQGSGAIIHISSVGAFAAQESASLYCATKSSLVGLTRGMALELIPYGIRVNCIAPGDIQIETNPENRKDLKIAGVSGDYFRKTPAGRRGTPREIGKAAVFLASDDAGYVVGETMVVDGGFLIY